jgi:hypothetical protein
VYHSRQVTNMVYMMSPYRSKYIKFIYLLITLFFQRIKMNVTSVCTTSLSNLVIKRLRKNSICYAYFFHTLCYLLQLYYLIIKFNQSLVMRYSFVMFLTLYVSIPTNKIVQIVINNYIFEEHFRNDILNCDREENSSRFYSI